MKISVVVPIYRVEAFIERCTRSLMEQDMEDVEYIFVDDCSPDGSMEVLKRVLKAYPQREPQVKLLRHEHNKGLPAARNTGLAAASGEYIFHCDSDDYMERGGLRALYETAKKNSADIVYSDWLLTFPQKERYMSCPSYDTAEEALRGLLHGTMKYNVWNKLVKRELYDLNGNIRFPEEHGMGEDMTMIMLFARARQVAYLPKATYHYMRQNENAFTAARSEESYDDLLFNASRVIKDLEGKVSEEDLACFKLNVKFPFLISPQTVDYERWNKWFSEADKYITAHKTSRRSKMLERWASKRYYLLLKAYYYCFHKVVYSIIYH